MALPALPLFCCWKVWGDSVLGTFSFLLAFVYSISTHLLSLTAPWSLFLTLPSLRPPHSRSRLPVWHLSWFGSPDPRICLLEFGL